MQLVQHGVSLSWQTRCMTPGTPNTWCPGDQLAAARVFLLLERTCPDQGHDKQCQEQQGRLHSEHHQ